MMRRKLIAVSILILAPLGNADAQKRLIDQVYIEHQECQLASDPEAVRQAMTGICMKAGIERGQ